MSLTKQKPEFKPFTYPWAFEAYKDQAKVHWLPEEVFSLGDDLKDYNNKLTDTEKTVVDNILAFFTQADIDVADAYYDNYIPIFKNTEVRMMMGTFAAMECIHVDAYSVIVEQLGLGDKTFSLFMDYKEMKDKHDYLMSFKSSSPYEVAKSIAAFSAFGEGLQLFASFAVLLNFPRFNKMKGMGQIVAWSVRDESLHVEGMIRVFKQYLKEKEFDEDTLKQLETEIISICETMVALEDNFIDLAFSKGDIQGLTSDELKQYIRYIANVRMKQLGYSNVYNIETNPLPWITEMLALPEHANFFENRSTEYSKGATEGNWDDVWNNG